MNPEVLLMRSFRTIRFFLLALLLSVTAAISNAQISISISVGFAPPMLPVYVQPPCPQVNLMWTPGYWAYSNDDGDYFWVPGVWVPAPYFGALWTPPYWGWNSGQYGFHDGYWGQTVGFYGGVNYGFGFGGVGFAGGEWRGGEFAYNTAVTQVDVTVIHTTYVNQTTVERGVVANSSHVAYNGGPGGIQHPATPEEQAAERQQHTAPTEFQKQHATTARTDKTSFAKSNGGHPANVVAAKPLAEEKHAPPAEVKAEAAPAEKAAPKTEAKPATAAEPKAEAKPAEKAAPKAEAEPKAEPKPAEKATPKAEAKPAEKEAPAEKPAPKPEPKPENL
jgi:WXXGXW repeat (2 copies)